MRAGKTLERAFHAAFGLLLLALLAGCAASWHANSVAALGAAAVLGAVLWLAVKELLPRLDALPAHRFWLVFLIVAVGYLALLLTLGLQMAEVLISDMGVVYDTLPEFLTSGRPTVNNDYYLICNNNLGLALVLAGWYRLLAPLGVTVQGQGGIPAGIALNALAVFAAVLLLCWAARLACERRSAALVMLVLAACFAPLYLWVPYFYSDTLCLPFLCAVPVVWLHLHKLPQTKTALPRAAIGGVLLGMSIFFGFAIKGSVAVALVAVLIALGLQGMIRAGSLRQAAAMGVAMVLCFGVLLGGYRLWQRQYLDWSNADAVCLPTELWLCYGSHGTGDYDDADATACKEQPTLNTRKALMRSQIAQNYAARTLVGNLDFAARKAVRTWGDGEYGAAEYLATPLRSNWTNRFTLYGQPGYMPLLYYCEAWQYFLLGAAAFGSLWAAFGQTIRRNAANEPQHPTSAAQSVGFLVRVALFGGMLFFSFWETKPRYALHFSPFLLFCAALLLCEAAPAPARPPAKDCATQQREMMTV